MRPALGHAGPGWSHSTTSTQYWSSAAGPLLGVFCGWGLVSELTWTRIYLCQLSKEKACIWAWQLAAVKGSVPRWLGVSHYPAAAANTNASDLKRSEQQLTAPIPNLVFPLAACFGDPSETLFCAVLVAHNSYIPGCSMECIF